MRKALELEFWGEIPVFPEHDFNEAAELPESYIVFEVAYSRHSSHGDNMPLMKKTNFDVNFITKQQYLKTEIPERITKSLLEKGFLFVNPEEDLLYEEATEYFGTTQEFCWYGGV